MFKQVQNVWTQNQTAILTRIDGWASTINNSMLPKKSARSLFREWKPLRIYTCVGNALKTNITFSVRFHGQEVAELKIINNSAALCLSKRHIFNNNKWFKNPFSAQPAYAQVKGSLISTAGSYPWTGRAAKGFRRYFKSINAHCQIKTGIPEHRIESRFIEEMAKDSSKKSAFLLVKDIQPVTIADCPLQFPLPISASKGVPVYADGHIDILARRRSNGRVHISVWELKSPGKIAHAIEQAYIYSCTLLLMLLKSGKTGQDWYKIFGFKRPLPLNLDIEAVIAVSKKQEIKLNSEYKKIKHNLQFTINGNTITMYAAIYDDSAPFKILDFYPL